MKMTHFPRLPAGFWCGRARASESAAFLAAAELWLSNALVRLVGSPEPDFTPAMIGLLKSALGSEDEATSPLPAGVRRFPRLERDGALGHMALEQARAVALWRAALLDHVADVWDVIGTPEHDVAACAAVERWLAPAGAAGLSPDQFELCLFCLSPLQRRTGAEGFVVHDHRCPALVALRPTRNSRNH